MKLITVLSESLQPTNCTRNQQTILTAWFVKGRINNGPNQLNSCVTSKTSAPSTNRSVNRKRRDTKPQLKLQICLVFDAKPLYTSQNGTEYWGKHMDLNMKNATAKCNWWCRPCGMLSCVTQHKWLLTFWRHYNPSKCLEPHNNTPNHCPASVESTTSVLHSIYCAVVSAQWL